ncbi:hypothetical protein BJY01DRAFT_256611 [Aspergillus pseudoustus]|uniref:BZIP domain-containing protein n=1 Tax=Aspergillus pseudoustus TaxID=1810923 RepID=A0ABR4I6Q6_9EURO
MSQPQIPIEYSTSGSSKWSNERRVNRAASQRFRSRKRELETLQHEFIELQNKFKHLQEELEEERKTSEFLRKERDHYCEERNHYRSQAPLSAQLDRPRSPKYSLDRILL